jgi:hypothetical protein
VPLGDNGRDRWLFSVEVQVCRFNFWFSEFWLFDFASVLGLFPVLEIW